MEDAREHLFQRIRMIPRAHFWSSPPHPTPDSCPAATPAYSPVRSGLPRPGCSRLIAALSYSEGLRDPAAREGPWKKQRLYSQTNGTECYASLAVGCVIVVHLLPTSCLRFLFCPTGAVKPITERCYEDGITYICK